MHPSSALPATPFVHKCNWLISDHMGLSYTHIRHLGRSHSVRGSPELREQRRAHSAGDCGGEKREILTSSSARSKDDLITCFTFFYTICPDCCLIMEVFLRGDSSYWICWSQLSAGSRQLRKVSKNVGALQSEDPDRRTLLLLSEELRHYCKGVFGPSRRLAFFWFSAAWMENNPIRVW